MSPQLSSDGLKINWINFKTGIPGVNFKMDADTHAASIAIVLTHSDTGIQELFYEQFLALKNLFHSQMQEAWHWQHLISDEYGKTISRISITQNDVNVLDKTCWPVIISFLKPRIIALDEFWSTAKYAFDALR